MITSRRITATLGRTLEVKAEQAMAAEDITADARPFDPTWRSSARSDVMEAIDLLDEAPDIGDRSRPRVVDSRSQGGGNWPLRAAAALVLVVALGGVGAFALLRGGSNEAPVGTVTVGDHPHGWLVPTWVPEGVELWGISWHEQRESHQGSEPQTIAQLLGDPDAGNAIYVTSSIGYQMKPDTVDPVRVRGHAGQAGTGWDIEESDMGDAVTWDERGITITALYNGMTRDEAIAALESLEWRSDDPADGFARPDDGELPLRAEVGQQPVGREASLIYSEGVPEWVSDGEGLTLDVHTSTGPAVSASYLEAWYQQESQAGGGQRSLSTYDEEWHQLTVLSPEGQSIRISPTGVPQSELPSRETLERIAASLTVAAEPDLTTLRKESEAKIEALPVLASAETSIGVVEVHGESGFHHLCLRRSGEQQPSCTTATDSGGGTTMVMADWTVDGAWYLAVASKGDEPQIVGHVLDHDRSAPGLETGGLPALGPEVGLPAETTTDGEWTIRLVQPPPDIEYVCVKDGGGQSCTAVGQFD